MKHISRTRVYSWSGARSIASSLMLTFVLLPSILGADADIYLPVASTINGRPIRLTLDTASGADFILSSRAAQKLGLKTTPPNLSAKLAVGEVPFSHTEPCDLTLTIFRFHAPGIVLPVVDLPFPDDANIAGFIGWTILRQYAFELRLAEKRIDVGIRVPPDLQRWTKLRVLDDSPILALEMDGGNGRSGRIVIDTGNYQGLILSPERWKRWEAENPNRPSTFTGYYQAASGWVVMEESWAPSYRLGNLTLHDVPVRMANRFEAAGPGIEAFLGLAALRRLYLIVDGPHRTAYIESETQPASPYTQQNRLGAVFLPGGSNGDGLLVAQVGKGTPAARAGIFTGDRLLEYDKINARNWRSKKEIFPLGGFAEPAGTEHSFVLRRGDRILNISVKLEDILGPSAISRT